MTQRQITSQDHPSNKLIPYYHAHHLQFLNIQVFNAVMHKVWLQCYYVAHKCTRQNDTIWSFHNSALQLCAAAANTLADWPQMELWQYFSCLRNAIWPEKQWSTQAPDL